MVRLLLCLPRPDFETVTDVMREAQTTFGKATGWPEDLAAMLIASPVWARSRWTMLALVRVGLARYPVIREVWWRHGERRMRLNHTWDALFPHWSSVM